jgi:hypothetical protein
MADLTTANGGAPPWLRCYRCWSENLEVQASYEGILPVDTGTGEAMAPAHPPDQGAVGRPARG